MGFSNEAKAWAQKIQAGSSTPADDPPSQRPRQRWNAALRGGGPPASGTLGCPDPDREGARGCPPAIWPLPMAEAAHSAPFISIPDRDPRSRPHEPCAE